MRPSAASQRRPAPALVPILVAAALIGASCATTVAPSPSASSPAAVATPSMRAEPRSPTAASPTAAPAAGGIAELAPGALAVTVSDRLRVRSAPGVSASSLKLSPLLPTGTQLVVTAGPVEASDYTWYRVAPIGVSLQGGVDQGWVAIADHDGTPWVALADDPTPGFALVSATVDRPDAERAAARAAAKAVNAFGIDLYRRVLDDPQIAPPGSGVVISPSSIVTALAMARAGAKGATADEMDAVLRVDGWKPLGAGLNSLDTLLRSRDAAWTDEYADDDRVHQLALRIANMAFGQDGYTLEEAYLERIGRTFGSGLGIVDYIRDPDAARAAINAWVSRQTMGRIPTLLRPPNITTDTRLVLVNAMYLKAEWARPFDPDSTTARDFTTALGETRSVPTMQVWGAQDIVLATGDGWKATELAYRGPSGSEPLAMTLILPDDLAAFEGDLSAGVLATIQKRIRAEQRTLATVTTGPMPEDCGTYPYNVRLFMPKFGVDTRGELVPVLDSMGMHLAFDRDLADFTGMTAGDRLHIGMVVHQANIDVDEKGTEAAAATAVGMDTGGCTGPQPAKTKTLRLNRPFVFALRDVETGAILFMGRVTDPSTR